MDLKDILSRCVLFRGLRPSALDLVASLGSLVTFQPGERLFCEGEEARFLYAIHEGRVALEMRTAGQAEGATRTAVVAVLGPGESLGWSAVVPPYVLTMSAVCLDPVVAVALPGPMLRRLMVLDWEIGYPIMAGLVDLVESRMASIRSKLAEMQAVTAHDVRSPAVTVAGYLEAVLAGTAGEITEEQRHILEGCRQRLHAQIGLLDQLLRVPSAGTAVRPADGPAPEPADGPVPEPVDGPAPEPADGPAPEPADGPAPEPAGPAAPPPDGESAGPIGAALVVGGGIAGIQASLDLADAGIKVYLVERGPAIGGRMATLDKTFPTNDCAMCILAPKLSGVGRHPNITLWACSEVQKVEGFAGNFRVAVKRRPRYVIEDRCLGCRECIEACVYKEAKVPDEFNLGLSKRKPIYMPFPQAVPQVVVIDPETCIEFKSGKCKKTCVEACGGRNAIDFKQTETIEQIEVGAVILAPGLEPFDGALADAYGVGRFANVLTGPQFERLLSASGPTQGHLTRPSDGAKPRRIAFLQCIGSRDQRHRYCSSVCCMYATKEAMLAREHLPEAECTIYYADMRAFGKGFEAYVELAKRQGIHYVRTRVAALREDPVTRSLTFRVEEDGAVRWETADMVVLSVGLVPPKDAAALAQAAGIELGEHGFARTAGPFAPLQTTRPGVFAAGGFTGPKDIPDSVVEGSAAAAEALALIGSARGTQIAPKVYPPELVLDPEPRIGVFICHCGSNIAGVVDVASLAAHARTLPGVALAETSLYACSVDTLARIKQAIASHHLNRVVVASCTPRTHEPIFREALREAGLNPYLFEMANIRDQCSWVHRDDPEGATEKARALIAASVARAARLAPLHKVPVPVRHEALIVGGGVSGMTAALNLADQGFPVVLVEREAALGGRLRAPLHLWDGSSGVGAAAAFLERLTAQVRTHPRITVLTGHRVTASRGTIGDFTTTVVGPEGEANVQHGVTIIATGLREWQPDGAGEDPRMITLSAFERCLADGAWGAGGAAGGVAPRSVAMLLCAGPWDRMPFYCSRICCGQSLAAALAYKAAHPEAAVAVLVREVRTYGLAEDLYTRARQAGVQIFRYAPEAPPRIERTPEVVVVTVQDQALGEEISLAADLLVVSPAQIPAEGSADLSTAFKVPVTQEGFFLEAHVKLRPADFASEGLFLCGGAHYPKPLGEAVAQALAASARAGTLLWRDSLDVGGVVASVDRDRCTTCLTCLRLCAYDAVSFDGDGIAVIDPARCQGCGVCVAACPGNALSLGHYTRDQVFAQIAGLLAALEATGVR